MLHRNLTIAIQGEMKIKVKESKILRRDRFTDIEWKTWKDKTVLECWENDYNNAITNLNESLKISNQKRLNQTNFISKNKSWNLISSFMQILQILLTVISLILYIKIVKSPSKK